MFTLPFAHKVPHATVNAVTESAVDVQAIIEHDRRQKELNAVAEHNMKVHEEFEENEKRKATLESAHAGELQKSKSFGALRVYESKIADKLLMEAFAYIYKNSLPHDVNFVAQYNEAIESMGHMYIRKIGGFKTLQAQAESTKSPFLGKLVSVITEQAKKLKKKKAKDVVNSITDEEASRLVACTVNPEEKEELLKNINSLGADELAELIKHKVIDVVRDEHRREKDERDFRTDLKNDLIDDSVDNTEGEDDDEKAAKESADPSGANYEKMIEKQRQASGGAGPIQQKQEKSADMNRQQFKAMEKKQGQPEPTNTIESMSFSEALEKWDPQTKTFTKGMFESRGLLYAIATGVTRTMMESAIATEGADVSSVTGLSKATSKKQMDNPMNLDVFGLYLKDNIGGVEDIEQLASSEPQILGGTGSNTINPEAIMTEALIQYTLLEAASTMKLVQPTVRQIKEQCDSLLRIA